MTSHERIGRRGRALACATLAFFIMITGKAMAVEGLTTLKSEYSAQETLSRLKSAITAAGMTVFAQVDHAAAAADVGLSLRATNLVIFGNPKGGTPLMQSVQTAGIDLPLKALIWQDASGAVWLSYNDPAWIVQRHEAEMDKFGQAMTRAIESAARAATALR